MIEQHVGVEARAGVESAEVFPGSVGSHRIELHPTTRRRTYVEISSLPFQMPLGTLLPIREENLLPLALLAHYQRLLASVLAIALPWPNPRATIR